MGSALTGLKSSFDFIRRYRVYILAAKAMSVSVISSVSSLERVVIS